MYTFFVYNSTFQQECRDILACRREQTLEVTRNFKLKKKQKVKSRNITIQFTKKKSKKMHLQQLKKTAIENFRKAIKQQQKKNTLMRPKNGKLKKKASDMYFLRIRCQNESAQREQMP